MSSSEVAFQVPRGEAARRALAILVVVAAGEWVFRYSLSGDAAVYFTYFRHFFERPFTFQPGTVSFGASSPLFVALGGTIFELFGEHWLAAMRVLNASFLAGGLWLLRSTLPRGTTWDALLLALALGTRPLWLASAQLYESSLAFLACSALYRDLKLGRDERALWICGLLGLVRPELVLVSLCAALHLLRKLGWRRSCWGTLALAVLPLLLYQLYMTACTGEWIPSNVLARGLESRLPSSSWWGRLRASSSSLRGQSLVMWLTLFLLPTLSLRTRSRARLAAEWILLGPLLAIFLFRPPGGYLARYLLPAAPVLLVLSTRFLAGLLEPRAGILAKLPRLRGPLLALASAAPALAFVAAVRSRPLPAHFDLDTLLLRDLGQTLRGVATSEQRVLLYEIQGQDSIDAFCISMDGIVGRQMHAALRGEQSFEQALRTQRIDFVVTMNALNYRRAFDDSLLERLYVHDLEQPVGARLELPGLSLEKLFSNPVFEREELHATKPWPGLNTGSELRVYGPQSPAWSGHHPLWNSVYRVRFE